MTFRELGTVLPAAERGRFRLLSFAMYLIEEGTKESLKWAPYLPQPAADNVKASARWELWGSSFSDPGTDFTELRLFDPRGRLLEAVRVAGY